MVGEREVALAGRGGQFVGGDVHRRDRPARGQLHPAADECRLAGGARRRGQGDVTAGTQRQRTRRRQRARGHALGHAGEPGAGQDAAHRDTATGVERDSPAAGGDGRRRVLQDVAAGVDADRTAAQGLQVCADDDIAIAGAQGNELQPAGTGDDADATIQCRIALDPQGALAGDQRHRAVGAGAQAGAFAAEQQPAAGQPGGCH